MRGAKEILEQVERDGHRAFLFKNPGAIEIGRHLFGVLWNPDNATDADITEIQAYLDDCGLSEDH